MTAFLDSLGYGMEGAIREINTTDATPTSFGPLFTPRRNPASGQKSANLCNIKVISIRTNSEFAAFQWLGAILVDTGNDLVPVEIYNGTASTAPDTSDGGGATLRMSIGINTAQTELEIKMTGNAGQLWRHRLVLEYSSIYHS